ncbi:MAG: tRNA (adenosine(37)-N6)-dimethylallyltransferase MiaA [Sphingorhabdus sp.]
MTNPQKRMALIAGPTASGKTALALALAQLHELTIINADSAQVYANLPILSAQPLPDEMARAPHRLFGYLDGHEACSAARWARDAKIEIEAAWMEKRLPVLVGGTGLYLRTLLDGIAPIPEIDPDIRNRVRQLSTSKAYLALEIEDPVRAAALSPHDESRVKRALEVIRSTGKTIGDWHEAKEGGVAGDVDLYPLILLPPRDWLYHRCNQRFLKMIAEGAIDEVKILQTLDLPADAPVLKAIGVPEIQAMLRGQLTQSEAIERGQIATRQYAKRQYTWFRNQPPETWPRWEKAFNNCLISYFESLFQS